MHQEKYLQELHSSSRKVAEVIELPPLAYLPMWVLQRTFLSNMRRHLSGTVLAAGLAVYRGWSLNLGGGMHHARHDAGAAFREVGNHHTPRTSATVTTAILLFYVSGCHLDGRVVGAYKDSAPLHDHF